jgi:phosphatidylglycerol:prolipoprotein diacylglycerol transferase
MMPVAFRIGSLAVSGYLLLYALGTLAGVLLILALARREKLDLVEVAAFLAFAVFCGWLGSRLFVTLVVQVSRFPRLTISLASLRRDLAGGGMFYGAALAFLLFAPLYARAIFREQQGRLLDIAVLGIALGQPIARLGCLASGCCFGSPTSLPWGVVFTTLGPHPHPLAGIPLHPVQLYEAVLCFANFLFLAWLWRRRPFPGRVFAQYLVNHALIRFAMEFLRHHGRGEWLWPGGLSLYQGFSLALLLAGGFFWRYYGKQRNAHGY